MKLLFPKQNYNVLSSSSYTHISVRDLYISMISLPILLSGNMWTDPGNTYINRSQTRGCGNWDWGRAIPLKKYINGIFLAVHVPQKLSYNKLSCFCSPRHYAALLSATQSTKSRTIPPRPLCPELLSTNSRHFSIYYLDPLQAQGVFSNSTVPYTFLRRIGLDPYQDPLGTGCLLLLFYNQHICMYKV
jgi:hypothetical protein